jgi:hypothetical protein
MKMPTSVNICGIPWEVILVERDSNEGTILIGKNEYGLCQYQTRRIVILNEGGPEEQLNTLLHEMTHAMNSVLNLWDDDNEQHVCRWAAVWADTLIRNGLVKL